MSDVKLSEKTKKLWKKIASQGQALPDFKVEMSLTEMSTLSLQDEESVDKGIKFLWLQLQLFLMQDAFQSMGGEPVPPEEKVKKSFWAKVKFWGLVVSGTLLAACEGFDGIVAILGVISLPTVAVAAVGSFFALASVLVFYGFDVKEISKNLGVGFKDATQSIDIYLEQLRVLQQFTQTLAGQLLNAQTSERCQQLRDLLKVMQARLVDLNKAKNVFSGGRDNRVIKAAKLIVAGIAGVLFFSSGFFAGQTIGLAFFAGVSASFPPVLALSIVVGLAAFAIYWFVERPGLEHLVGNKLGVDREKIDQLLEGVDGVKEKSVDSLEIKLSECAQQITNRRQELDQLATPSPRAVVPLSLGHSHHSTGARFFNNKPRSWSMGDSRERCLGFKLN